MKLIKGMESGVYEAWLWEGIFYVRFFFRAAKGNSRGFGTVFDQFPKQESSEENWKRFDEIITNTEASYDWVE